MYCQNAITTAAVMVTDKIHHPFLCFDDVGWVAGRASSL